MRTAERPASTHLQSHETLVMGVRHHGEGLRAVLAASL